METRYSHLCIHSGKSGRLQAGYRPTLDLEAEDELVWDGKNSEFSVFDFEQVLEATTNFSEENKLGQGGFGAVYKVNLLKADMPSSRFFLFSDFIYTMLVWINWSHYTTY